MFRSKWRGTIHADAAFLGHLVKGIGTFQLLDWVMGSGLARKCEFEGKGPSWSSQQNDLCIMT